MAALLAGMNVILYMIHRLKTYTAYMLDLPKTAASENLEESVANLHALVLQFLARALLNFGKSTTARLFSSLWKPESLTQFEADCDKWAIRADNDARNCEASLSADDRKKVDSQLRLMQAKLLELAELKHIRNSLAVLEIKAYLDSLAVAEGAAFDSYEERHNAKCLKDTRVDLLELISKWATQPASRPVFWLNGMAGTGKSTISRTIAQSLSDGKMLGASFFFKRGQGNRGNARRFFTTIAVQLAQAIPALRYELVESLRASPDIAAKSLIKQFEMLLQTPLLRVGPGQGKRLIILVDALDECEDEGDVRSILDLLFTAMNLQPDHLRLFVTSRPELPLRLGFAQISGDKYDSMMLHEIAGGTIKHDIFYFLSHELATLKQEYNRRQPNFPLAAEWPLEQDIRSLTELAIPLFIFAATVCRFISGPPGNPKRRLDTVLHRSQSSSSTKLSRTYLPILEQLLLDQDEEEQMATIADFQELIGTIILLEQPLSPNGLAGLLDLSCEDVYVRLMLLHSVFSVPDDPKMPIGLLHLSFRDFLVDSTTQSKSAFFVNEKAKHTSIFLKCLELLQRPGVLKQDMCCVNKPGVRRLDISKKSVEVSIPTEVSYAARYWVVHFNRSCHDTLDWSDILRFLETHLLHWLEVLAWLGDMSEAVTQIDILLSVVASRESSTLGLFLHDAKRFLLRNARTIDLAPFQIYISALVFAPGQSIVRKKFLPHPPGWLESIARVPDNWSADLFTFEGHTNAVNGLAFVPSGEFIVSTSDDHTIRLWSRSTGQEVKRFEHDGVQCVGVSPDGSYLALGIGDGRIILLDILTGDTIKALLGHRRRVTALVFSPDGTRLASGSDLESEIGIQWDTSTGAPTRLDGHGANAPVYSPDDLSTAWGFNIKGTKALAYSADGLHLATAWGSAIRIWDAQTAVQIRMFDGNTGSVLSLAFSPDGPILVSGATGKAVQLWDTSTGGMVAQLDRHTELVSSVAFSPNGLNLASISMDRSIRLWDRETGSEIRRFTSPESIAWANFLSFSPDGRHLASGSEWTIRLWDLQLKAPHQNIAGSIDHVTFLSFSPDGQLLASASIDNTIKVWAFSDGRMVQSLSGHSACVNTIAFNPSGSLLASGADEPTIRLWSVTNGSSLALLGGDVHCEVYDVKFSPDGQLLASCSNDSTTILWDTSSGDKVGLFPGLGGKVLSVAFSRDSRRIASASRDGTVTVRDISPSLNVEAKKLHLHLRSQDKLTAVALARESDIIAMMSSDGCLRLWDSAEDRIILQVNVGSFIYDMSFCEDDLHLQTNRGLLHLHSFLGSDVCRRPPDVADYWLDENEGWLERRGEHLVFLPYEYRQIRRNCVAFNRNTFAFGRPDGVVWMTVK